MPNGKRRLAAIAATDMVGYSRLMELDEVGTLERQKAIQEEVIGPRVADYGGRVVKTTGDGALIEFDSTVNAMTWATSVQREIAEREAETEEGKRISYRIGINVGDILVDGDDIFGDGVNVAVRLEGLAEPGGILVSEAVFRNVRGKLDLGFADLGAQSVKNISEPVRAYRVLLDRSDVGKVVVHDTRRGARARGVVFATAFCLVAGIAFYFLDREMRLEDPATVAVLPFVNLSDDNGQEYLAVGLAEDLLTDLSRSGSLTVLSRSSTFGYREVADAAARVRNELGATHLIDGSLQREGERIRISVQLVDAKTGVSIWAERFDREIGGLFDVQDEVRTHILRALSSEFGLYDSSPIRPGTTEVTAYDMLLQGRYLEASLTRSGIVRAIELYKRAIDIDPSYGDAYARLANMYDFSSRFGWSGSVEGDRALALEMAERAIRLEPENPFAHWSQGRILSRLDSSEESAERALAALKRAIRLDPNYADAYAFAAFLYVGGGDVQQGRKAIDTAFRLNPDAPSWYIRNRGIISYFEGDFELAIADFTLAAERNPTAHFSRLWLAAALAQTGRIDDAEWELEEGLALGAPATVEAILESNELIRDPAFRTAYAKGLRAAGVPD